MTVHGGKTGTEETAKIHSFNKSVTLTRGMTATATERSASARGHDQVVGGLPELLTKHRNHHQAVAGDRQQRDEQSGWSRSTARLGRS